MYLQLHMYATPRDRVRFTYHNDYITYLVHANIYYHTYLCKPNSQYYKQCTQSGLDICIGPIFWRKGDETFHIPRSYEI